MSSVTAMPSSVAAALTGLGETEPPRPRRRSGRVTARTISWPAAARACSSGTAMSGVPRKTMRTTASAQTQAAGAAGGRLRRGLEALVLGEGLTSLVRRHPVEHEDAVEVVELVLEHAG